jgi:predicted metal-dependent TIM-barrel fold hydrolase
VGQSIYLCQASDISPYGIFLAHVNEDTVPIAPKCWLEFSLPGSRTLISARAELVRQFVHARFLLSAMRFAAIAPSHRRLIASYVNGPPIAAPAPVFLPH